MKFIDFFAGIGGFRRGLELAGHKCVGFCEWDKFAAASYTSMHLITEEQRQELSKFTIKKRQKEILKEEYRNGEWYANDIRNVDAKSLPMADCWCFGAPCQDFSIAGKRAGLDGDRSSLIREIFRLLEEQKEENRPEWLIYENVKGMLSSNRGLDYLSILSEMDRLGYDIEWQNINSKWFVPQNRERIYTVGHLRRFGRRKVLPVTGADGENNIQIIGHRKGYRKNMQTFSDQGITEAILTCQGEGREHHVAVKIIGTTNNSRNSANNVNCIDGCMSTILSRDYKGAQMLAIPVLTPDRAEKRQNGRRFKENGEPMFTITAQDRHGVAMDVIGRLYHQGKTHQGDEIFNPQGEIGCMKATQYKNPPKTLLKVKLDKKENGIYIEMPRGFLVYCVWYEKYNCYITVRKLTPKECFRLQGWTDDYFEKAAFVNSDSQLYKQAGNGVTVNVVREIGRKIPR